jgi:photosystem II stability/assembly factor-like uncharacterized protein
MRIRRCVPVAAVVLAAACGSSSGSTAAPPPAYSAPSPSQSASQSPVAPSVRPVTGPGSGTAAGPVGGPVPKGFAPTDATFLSASDGWAIGTAPCRSAPCTSIVRTRDGGRSWVGIPAPRADLTGLRFASPLVGYAFRSSGGSPAGSSIYATTDGGASWHLLRGSDAEAVAAVEPGASGAYAATGYGAKPNYVQRVSPSGITDVDGTQLPSGRTSLAVHGPNAFAVVADGSSPVGFVAVLNGRAQRSPAPCPSSTTQAVVGASGDTNLVLVCGLGFGAGSEPKLAFTSADAGRSWTRVNPPPAGGYLGSVAATSAGTFVTGGRAPIYVTRDSGRSWQDVWNGGDGQDNLAAGFVFVGFTDSQHGVAVAGSPNVHEIDLTVDGGRTWTPHQFG